MGTGILFDQINHLTMYFCTFGVVCAIGIVESDFQGTSASGTAEIVTRCEIVGPGGNYLPVPMIAINFIGRKSGMFFVFVVKNPRCFWISWLFFQVQRKKMMDNDGYLVVIFCHFLAKGWGQRKRPEDYRWCSMGLRVRNPKRAKKLLTFISVSQRDEWSDAGLVAKFKTMSTMACKGNKCQQGSGNKINRHNNSDLFMYEFSPMGRPFGST